MTKDHKPVVVSDIEEALPQTTALATDVYDSKGSTDHLEKLAVEDEDPNSPFNILQRYPLLRDRSEKDLDLLNRRVRRRIDLRMMPTITLCLMINYLDRSNVTNARVAGMQRDMGMNDVQWSLGISLFYVGYMLTQLPGALLLAKYRPRIVIPLVMLGWSIPTILFPFVRSPAGFAVARFAVGFAEGPFFPAVALMTSSWYVKEELPFRMAVWHGAQTLSNVFGGPFAAAILENMDGIRGMHAWEWFMIIEGAVSIIVALAAGFLLPNWAHNTPWLTPEETEMAQYRLVLSAGGEDDSKKDMGMWAGAKLGAKDPITWLFMALHFWLLCAQSFKDFLPSILRAMSTSNLMTYLLQSPCYLLGYLAILFFGWTSGKFKDSVWHSIGPILLSAAGTVMLITSLNIGVRYTGVCFLIMGVFSGLNIQISWMTQLVPGPRHKKAAMIAIANTFGSASHWFTPYFFLTNQAPKYQFGGGLILVSIGLTILTVLATWWYVVRLNKKLDANEDGVNVDRVDRGLPPLEKGWRYPL